MLHEIHQQSYILPDMSQLNPKYFWIRLTSLENISMFIFKLEVNIFSILFTFRTNWLSHTYHFCNINVEIIKSYKNYIHKKQKSQTLVDWTFSDSPSGTGDNLGKNLFPRSVSSWNGVDSARNSSGKLSIRHLDGFLSLDAIFHLFKSVFLKFSVTKWQTDFM